MITAAVDATDVCSCCLRQAQGRSFAFHYYSELTFEMKIYSFKYDAATPY